MVLARRMGSSSGNRKFGCYRITNHTEDTPTNRCFLCRSGREIGASMRLFEREDYLEKIRGFYHDDGVVKALAGVRRCGKSCLMQTIAEEFKETGTREDHVIYLDRYGFRSVRMPGQLEALIGPVLRIGDMKYSSSTRSRTSRASRRS